MLLGTVAIGHDRLQPSTIRSRNQGAHDLSHASSMPHPCPFVNPMSASVHYDGIEPLGSFWYSRGGAIDCIAVNRTARTGIL
jgi:hypothetical protein